MHETPMKYRWTLFLLWFSLMVVPLGAQEAGPETETGIAYGAQVTGKLDSMTPRAVYYFDGWRCEVVSLSLTPTSGDLDPVVAVMSESGDLLVSRDDTAGERAVNIETLRIPRSDRYYIVVGRFGYGLGSTAGEYQLDIERIGVSSASGCMLRYGDSVTNTISNLEPQFYYSFQATRGDIINIRMQRMSGNLDPYLQVVNSDAYVIADNDDAPDIQRAEIDNLLIEETGTYAIIASRYGQEAGNSAGSFFLSIQTAANSGSGNSARGALPIQMGAAIEDILTDELPAKYYTFEAARNDLVTIRMRRGSTGRLDPVLVLANAGLQELARDDDSGGSKDALISEFLIPADGTYYIIASRFEETATIGPFKLDLQYDGNAFDGVPADIPRISYGMTVTGNIDDAAPQVLFAFWGVEGDVITVSMNRGDGDLDPVVSILNSEQRPLVSNDDDGTGQNARVDRFRIPSTGIYYVRAMRYSGSAGPTNTRGSFIVVLARRFD